MTVESVVLKNRSTIDNRYSLSEVFVDSFVRPGTRRYGLWKSPELRPRPELSLLEGTYKRYTVTASDIGRIDLIAWKFYRNVSWWWVIARYNSIENALTDLVIGQVLLIPNKELITQAIEKDL